MADEGSQGFERPAEQPTAEQAAVPPPGFEDEPVTSEFAAPAQPGGLPDGPAEPAFDPHPEIAVGGAFIGGFLLGRLLRRLGR
jgi:hypothetical protein